MLWPRASHSAYFARRPFWTLADGEESSGSALGWDTRAEGSGSDEPKQS